MTKRRTRPLDEVIDLHRGLCDEPMLVTRGQVYATYRHGGESDFIAGRFAFGSPAVDAEPNTTTAALEDYLRRNCNWVFPGDAEAA